MSSTIFMIGSDNRLTELRRSDYVSEDLLQQLLADHPAILGLIAGEAGRLLLVRREFAVPDEKGASDRWSLDHLFLDREGVPVLVEVKRASDTRARREVVAQMLDCAANGVAFWPPERIVTAFRETSAAAGRDPDAHLAEFLDGQEPEAFWRQVEANLRSGRIRMVFVADAIAKELRRIVEFLNEQMRPAEVLAIEVEQFVDASGGRTLVPRLLGATERAQAAKAIAAKEPISFEDWLSSFREQRGERAGLAAAQVLDWFRAQGFEVGLTDTQDAAYVRVARRFGKPAYPFFVRRGNGKLETSLFYVRSHPRFSDDERRRALLDEIRGLPGATVTTTNPKGWPAIPLEDLAREGLWPAFQALALRVKADLEAA